MDAYFEVSLYLLIVLGLCIGMILTFWKPKKWKYFTLLGFQGFFTLVWTIQMTVWNSQSWGKFGPPNAYTYISLALPLVVIMLIVTVIVGMSTRHRWYFPDDKPGFCS